MTETATGGAADAARKTITLPEAARELGVNVKTVLGWAKAGHLPVFVPPGRSIGGPGVGRRGYKIFLDEWESFKRRQTVGGRRGEKGPGL